MNNFLQFAIAQGSVWRCLQYQLTLIVATTVILMTPSLPVPAFETEDFNQLKASRICNNECDLSNADLSEVYLVEVDLENANLQGAYLNEVNLNNALLEKANLSEADLAGAYLRGASFQKADLRQAKLNRADFKGVILNQANVQGTHLITAKNLKAIQIKSTCNWQEAIYDQNDDANQKFISDLQQDLASDPERPVDCSIWE